MEQKPLTIQSWSSQDIIKVIPILAIGASTICFILGLVVVNLYLAKYGIYSTEFLRTDYILIGALLLTLITISEICMRYFLRQMYKVRSHWGRKYFALAVILFFLAFLAFVPIPVVLVFLHGASGDSIKSLWKPVFAILFTWGITRHILSEVASIIFGVKSSKPIYILENKLHNIALIGPMILIGLGIYSNLTYPFISTAYGGANRTPVILLPTLRGLEVCKMLALPIQVNQTVGPIDVLTESENELTVLIQNGISENKIAIRLNRELFDAVQARSQGF